LGGSGPKSLILRVFLRGILGKVVCWRWYFAGEFVVKCVTNVVGKRRFFAAKNISLFSTLFFAGWDSYLESVQQFKRLNTDLHGPI
jgi:hypothetical protein